MVILKEKNDNKYKRNIRHEEGEKYGEGSERNEFGKEKKMKMVRRDWKSLDEIEGSVN